MRSNPAHLLLALLGRSGRRFGFALLPLSAAHVLDRRRVLHGILLHVHSLHECHHIPSLRSHCADCTSVYPVSTMLTSGFPILMCL